MRNMNVQLFPLDEFATAGVFFLIDAALKSSLLLLAALAATRLLRRRSAATLHGVWTMALTACLAVPPIALVAPAWTLPILPRALLAEAATSGATRSPDSSANRAPSRRSIDASASGLPQVLPPEFSGLSGQRLAPDDQRKNAHRNSEPSSSDAPTASLESARAATPAAPRISWLAATLAVWMIGVAICSLRAAWHEVSLHCMLRRCREISDPHWLRAVADASQTLAFHRRVQLKQLNEASTPMVAGILRTVVILPRDADQWSPARRQLVLLHELAHAKRHDILTQTIAGAACALYWFNPLAWFGLSQIRKLRELACDDMVIAAGQPPADYADALLDVARTYRHRRLAAAVGMARGADVENRITAILDKARSRVALSRKTVSRLAALAAAVALVIGSVRLQSQADDSPAPTAAKEKAAVKMDDSASSEPKAADAVAENAKATLKSKPKSRADADPNGRTLEVHITDEAGKPLEGATVTSSIWEFDGDPDYPTQDYITSADGVALVRRPSRLHILRLWPEKPGYVTEFLNFAEGTHEEGQRIPDRYDFQLARGTPLSGTVVDEAGNPIAGVNVEARVDVDEPVWGENPKPMISTWIREDGVTDQDGKWTIDGAPAATAGADDFAFRLKFNHKDYISDSKWSELQNEQRITTAALRDGSAKVVLSRGVVVTGGVFGADWKPVTKGLVIWHDDPYFAEGVNEAPIDDKGHFKTPALPPGKRWMTVLAPGHCPERQEVTIAKFRNKVQFSLKPGKRLTFKVVDKDGKPIPNTYVGMGEWRGSKSIYNEKHPNVPESHVPRHADENGVYTWDWAPEDAVTYHVSAKGYTEQTATLTATETQHIVTLFPPRVAVGNVTDAATGASVAAFSAMPVIVFSPKFLTTRFEDAVSGADGRYEAPLVGGGDPDYRYRVRVEADGYRSVLSEKSYGLEDGRVTQDFALEAAAAREGVVVDSDGQPVEGAAVIEATPSIFPSIYNGKLSQGDRQVETSADGKFQLRATTEPYRLRVMHDAGFAEIARTPDEPIGTIRLVPWASVSGRLLQDGKPVAKQSIYFNAAAEQELGNPRYQGSYYQVTDADGRFNFDRLPPIVGAVRTQLGPWEESPLTSGESAPLDLQPGEQREITLGGEGATIAGKVIATGRDEAPLDKHWSLNYLISRDRGVDLPDDFPSLGFDPRQPVEASWFLDPNHTRWLATRANYFVKLTPDGDLRINGVPPGTYDLVLRLYEQPAGCLVETVGEKVVAIEVTEEDVTAGPKDLGQIEVVCRAGPRVGENMSVYQFTDPTGRVQSIADMQGRYVLMHVWASWCAPCLETMPDVAATADRLKDKPITFVGLNIDKDPAAAKALTAKHNWTWSQNYLGESSDMARQLAISSAPTYFLIGPDGLLVASATEWAEIKKKLAVAMDAEAN
jgi:beta-lactamase regulating signal transducer with metallopeptidase domain/thiol-disulfide isomerase/thioredoxin